MAFSLTSLSVDPEDIRDLIINSNEPLIFKNILKWQLRNWELNDWGNVLGTTQLSFRCGKNLATKTPQWERSCTNQIGEFSDFAQFVRNCDSENWMYFDYKHLNEWFTDKEELLKEISWDSLGFNNIEAKDSTIWIGSKGAHTPCHKDTYGFNLVGQVYGKKLWLLFPPEEDLQPTRFPYEESSIYSKLSFFSPILSDFKDIASCRKVILEPGDVLYVPHKWWHYVENLETAISINTWVPHNKDDEERLSESVIQFLVCQIVPNMNEQCKNLILNPNSDQLIEELSMESSLNIVQECIKRCKNITNFSKSSNDFNKTLNKYNFIQKITPLTTTEFYNLLDCHFQRFKGKSSNIDSTNEFENITELLSAIISPDVIALIQNKLLNK